MKSTQIAKDVIDRVRDAHDIVDVVGRTVPLKKVGSAWKALCPFHEEKTPSFTVNPARQTFKCFGCQKGGDVFGFVMERDRLAFPQAVRALAAERGIEVPDGVGREGPDASRVEALRAALALAQDLYVRTLWSPEGAAARAYLHQRGFPDPAVKAFGLGLSPASWDGLLVAARAKGIPPAVLEDAGLAIPREGREGWYDRFRHRLMFPVADVAGRLATYGARALRPEDTPKYLNGPETPVFKKGHTLFGLDRAKEAIRKSGTVVLMEGYTDVLMAHMHGFTQAVAGMGTAFTEEQAKALSRQDARRAILLYDGDQAGRLAAEKSLDVLLERGFEVRVATLPEGKDVDEVLLEEGEERLQAVLDAARDLFDFKLEQLARTEDLSTPRGKALAADRLVDSIRRVKNPIERDQYLRRTAERLDVPSGLLMARAAEFESKDRRGPRSSPRGAATPGAPAPGGESADLTPEARSRRRDQRLEHEGFLLAAIHRPELLRELRGDLPPEEVWDFGLASLYRAVLTLAEAGEPVSAQALGKAVAGDEPATLALAGLPDEPPSEDWVRDALRHRRTRRAQEDRRRALRHLLAPPPPSPQDVPPGELPSDGS